MDEHPPHERALAHALGLPRGRPATRPGGPAPAADAGWHGVPTDHGLAWAFITLPGSRTNHPCGWTRRNWAADRGDSAQPAGHPRPWFAEDGITLVWTSPRAGWPRAAPTGLARPRLDPRTAARPEQLATRSRPHKGPPAPPASEMQMLLYTTRSTTRAAGLPRSIRLLGAWRGRPANAPRPAAQVHDRRACAPAGPGRRLDRLGRAWAGLDAGPVAQLAAACGAWRQRPLTLCGERQAP